MIGLPPLFFDFDRTVVTLGTDIANVRLELSSAAASAGFVSGFRPILAELERFAAFLGDEARARELRLRFDHLELKHTVVKPPPRKTIEVLGQLAGRFSLVIVSNNGAPVIEASLRAGGCRDLFAGIYCRSDLSCYQHAKPHPWLFQRHIDEHGLPKRLIMVGDSGVDLEVFRAVVEQRYDGDFSDHHFFHITSKAAATHRWVIPLPSADLLSLHLLPGTYTPSPRHRKTP